MQIPKNLFPFGPGFLRQPQPGTRQPINDELQAKAVSQGTGAAAPAQAAAPANSATPPTRPAATPDLSAAGTLDEAVRTLRADGRLPARGSLVDLRA